MSQRISYSIKLPTRTSEFRLWFVGDAHIGAADFDKERFLKTVNYIKNDKLAWWIGMGDYCDFINYKDPRFDPTQLDQQTRMADLRDLARFQYGKFVKYIEPIKDKCIVLLTGNHEEKWTKFYHYDIGWYLCDRLNANFGSYDCFIKLFVGERGKKKSRYTLDVYAHHGWGAARTEGGDLNKLHAMALDKDMDIFAMGHGHKKLANIFPRLGIMGKEGHEPKWQERPMAFILTGAYKRTYAEGHSSYSAIKGYRAVNLGSPYVKIKCMNKSESQNWVREQLSFEAVI